MSEFRKNDEHWRDNLIGLIYSKRLEKAVHERHGLESQLVRLDMQKDLIHKKMANGKIELLPNIYEGAIVAALNPKNKKILDIGFNTPEDLILNNFGIWLAGLIQQPRASVGPMTNLTDITNTSKGIVLYYNNVSVLWNGNSGKVVGTNLQLGAGTTAAARSNYKIETALGTAPESGRFATGTGSYSTGYVVFSGSIAAGGSSTANEMGLFASWLDQTGSVFEFMLFRDILASGVAYSAGNILMASYSITL